MSKLKQNIQRVLHERDISLAKLALLSGVQQSTLHRIMAGGIREPRSSTIAPLAAFLGVTVQILRDGDLPVTPTFDGMPTGKIPLSIESAEQRTPNADWDKETQLRSFASGLADSVPRPYMEWSGVVDGNRYRLDYCSERLALDLLCFSRFAPLSHSSRGRVDFSGLFSVAASHLVDLFMVHAAYPNLTPLLLIMCPELPDEDAPSVRKLLTSGRRLGVLVRFATTGFAAAQLVMKTERDAVDASALTENE